MHKSNIELGVKGRANLPIVHEECKSVLELGRDLIECALPIVNQNREALNSSTMRTKDANGRVGERYSDGSEHVHKSD